MSRVYYTLKATGWLTFFIVSLLTINSLWAQAPTNGLIAHYPFNGNANDESGGGQNGIVNGATLSTDRFGNANKAYSFDGLNDNIVVGDHASLKTSDFTYSFWMRPTDYGICSIDYPNIATMVMAKYGWYQGFIIYNNPAGNYNIRPHSPTSTTIDNSLLSGGSVPLNQWTHMTYTKTGQMVKIYVNGVVSSTAIFTGAYGTSSDNLYIGSGPWQLDEFFKGKLDDIHLYNRGLSDTEVQNLFQAEAPVTGTTNGLIAYYPFNGNANDGSGNNNNGTVQGATLVADRRGTPNGAYRFSDGAKIVVANSASLTLNNAYSFSGWFNLRSFEGRDGLTGAMSTTMGNHVLFSKNCDGDRLYFYLYPSPDGIPRLRFRGGAHPSVMGVVNTVRLDTWVHVALTYDINVGSNLFINGILEGFSGTPTDLASSNQSNLIIGGMICWPYFFNGDLDDFRFYNRALSTVEVKTIFLTENGPIQSIKTGSWLDPTTWSCSCIPSTTNPVEVKHVVNVPAAQTGYALSLKYGVGGRIDLGANAKLKLVQE